MVRRLKYKMNLFEKILFYVSVPKCIFCKEPLEIDDRGLCKKCKEQYDDFKDNNCSLCKKPLYECSCTSKYLESHFVHKLVKIYRYKNDEPTPSNNLIYHLKRDNRRDVVKFLADELTNAIKNSLKIDENTVFTSVPRRRSERIKYGIDHAEKLSKAIAKNFSAKYMPLLKSKANKAQKASKNTEERLRNANFKLKSEKHDLHGKTVIIIDDVVTTGASMGTAAFNIKALGPKKIHGACIAIAYKDPYIQLSEKDRFSGK